MNLNYEDSNRFLGMLAEVAAQTLNYEENNLFKQLNDTKHKKLNKNVLNVQQIRKLSDKVLVDSFSDFTCDEIRRVYSFKCCLIPVKCEVIFESFAAEDRARNLMRDHLLAHIQSLEPSFTAETISARNRRLIDSNKNSRKSLQSKNCPKAYNQLNNRKELITNSTLNCLRKSKSTKLIDSQTNHLFPKLSFNINNNTNSSVSHQISNNQEVNNDSRYSMLQNNRDKSFDEDLESDKLHNIIDNNEKIWLTDNGLHNEDHCYTSLDGPKLEFKKSLLKSEFSINIKKKTQNMTKVIATPAFPFVYEPVLPNISQVIEIGSSLTVSQLNCNKRNSNDIELKTNRTTNNSSSNDTNNTTHLKRLALQYINDIRIKSRGQTDKTSFSCKICIDKSFTSPTTLIYHYRSHAGVKPFECSLCKATFTRQHSLNYHMLIHLNKSRFVCEECGRNFRHPSHFKEHMRRHTGETPYECNDCFIKFKTRNTYKRHLQTKHGKMLTSKGIFDLPNSNIHLRKPCPPRRKYGLGFLHQNIEAVARYERAQEQVNQAIRDNHVIDPNELLINDCKNFNSKNNFEKLLQAVAIAEDDQRSAVG